MTRSTVLRLLVLSVCTAAVAAALVLPHHGLEGRVPVLAALAALAFVAGTQPVRLASLRTELTATEPFLFCALGLLGPFWAGWVAVAGVAGAAIGRGRRPAPIRLVFNVGGVLLSSYFAGWTFVATGGVPGKPIGALIGPLWVAAVAFFAANTALVSLAISLESGAPLVRTWRAAFSWTPAAYLAGLAVAVAMLLIFDSSEVWALILGILSCWLVVSFYRSHPAAVRSTPSNGVSVPTPY